MRPDFSKFNDGLVPAIAQDVNTGTVLMMGYMSNAAYDKTNSEKVVTFFSRSKQRLWTKGETSGNHLALVEILNDCDNDCLLLKVVPTGPVCHTGSDTCFSETNELPLLIQLEKTIEERKGKTPAESYVAGLFYKGINAIAQKVGEEAVELVIEAKDNDDEKFLNEAADLVFHLLVLLNAKGKSVNDVFNVLEMRKK